MCVRRLFSRGKKNLKNNKKDTFFPKKSLKICCFWPAWPASGGKSPPCPPADAHVIAISTLKYDEDSKFVFNMLQPVQP